ncbi:hypothetical protein PM082_015720 [Marasmius tenuissimus]|nr:hypothetical protein PM082_015720 [Marasmius tenuissimus]
MISFSLSLCVFHPVLLLPWKTAGFRWLRKRFCPNRIQSENSESSGLPGVTLQRTRQKYAMVYYLRSRVVLQASILAQQTPITPLVPPSIHSFDFASRANYFELRSVAKSQEANRGDDPFGEGEDLTELSESEVETEPGLHKLAFPALPLEKAMPSAPSPPATKQKAQGKKRSADTPSSRAIEHALKPSQSTPVSMHALQLDAAYGAHTGKLGTKKMGSLKEREVEYDVEDLVEIGFDHIKWDGVTPMPIVEAKNRVISCLVGRPNCKGYLHDTELAHQAMMSEGEQAELASTAHNAVCGKRGGFSAFTKGVTMGMGSKTPVLLATDNQQKGMGAVLQRLVDMTAFKRISQYHNAAFKLWGLRLYKEYKATMDFVFNHPKLSHIPRNFSDDNIFAAAAFNFGGKVRTFKHRDHLNWAFGWCAITALGNFNPTKSARLVLWELKLVVDFPPGLTVLIPSAVITHSNTRITEGDERTSFTQYTAGAIFRWVENGGMTDGELREADSGAWTKTKAQKSTAASKRIQLYSTLEELLVHVDSN